MRRLLAIGALVAVVVGLGFVLRTSGGDSDYTVQAEFGNAAGLRTNSRVDIGGQPVGKVRSLKLDRRDHVIATLAIKHSAGPVGRGATAKVRPANLLGEKYVDLKVGGSGGSSDSLIPAARTGAPVELDDVVNVLDSPTRTALSVLINESGIALTGRRREFSETLLSLPPSLDRVGTLLTGLSRDNRALGSLIESSDRVVGSIATRRASLGRLVGSADRALTATAARDRELAETLRRAPGSLAQLRGSLGRLQNASVPLGQASDQLTNSAPSLTALLKQVRPFTKASRPTLARASSVAPQLTELGRRGAPSVRKLRPVASDLRKFSSPTFNRFTDALAPGTPDFLGTLEGWARAIQGRDAAGHLFRNDASLTGDTLNGLINSLARNPSTTASSGARQASSRRASPTPAQPSTEKKRSPNAALDYLLGP